MHDFPIMLYRPGTEILWDGANLDTLTVASELELESALREEWVTAATLLTGTAEPRVKGKLRAVAVDAAAA